MAGRARASRREPDDNGPDRAGRGLATKKKRVHAAKRDTERVRGLRAAFVETVQAEYFTCFKYADETSTGLTYGRRYTRTEGGQRAHQTPPARRTERDAGDNADPRAGCKRRRA